LRDRAAAVEDIDFGHPRGLDRNLVRLDVPRRSHRRHRHHPRAVPLHRHGCRCDLGCGVRALRRSYFRPVPSEY
jgi:hypothetical protein